MARRRGWNPEEDRVIVVAAGQAARQQARRDRVYNCQNGRRFQPSRWIAFYANGQIDTIAEIDGAPEDDVMLAHRRDLEHLAAEAKHSPYQSRTLFKLKSVEPIGPVINDKKDKHGRNTAWTQSQRYTTLSVLRAAKATSELEPSRRQKPRVVAKQVTKRASSAS